MIATILLVAITVVLAAILYVMFLGFNNGVGDTVPKIGLVPSTSNDGTKWIVMVSTVTGPIAAESDLTLRISASNGSFIRNSLLSNWTDSNGVTFYDGGNTNIVEPGDYWTLDKIAYIAGMQIQIIHPAGIAGQTALF